MDSIANSKIEAETMTTVLTAATHREVIYVKATLRAEGLVIDIAATIYTNNLESTISATRKAAGLYNTL